MDNIYKVYNKSKVTRKNLSRENVTKDENGFAYKEILTNMSINIKKTPAFTTRVCI